MPVIYAPELTRYEGLEGGIWGDIADFLGLRNPLTYYYPDMTPHQIFNKIDADMKRYAPRITLLRSKSSQPALVDKAKSVQQGLKRIRPAFVPGAKIGERDLSRLKEVVVSFRAFRRDLWHAEKAFGSGAPVEPHPDPKAGTVQVTPTAPTRQPVPVQQEQEAPPPRQAFPVWGYLALGGAALLLVGGGALFGRRRT
jgi:hypothetical protein